MVRNDSKDLHADGDFYRKLGEILVGIKKSTKTFLVYAENHPARAQALGHTHKQITELLAQRAPLSFQIRHEGFYCDEVAVGGDHPFLRDFAPVLALRGIQAIRLLHGVRFEDVQHLTELLILEAEDLSRQGGGRAFLEAQGTTAIEVEGFDMEFVETGFAQPGSAIQGENPAPEPLQPTAPSAPADLTSPQAAQMAGSQVDTETAETPGPGETEEQEGSGEAEAQKEEEEARPDLDTLILELQKTDRPARYENITQELSQLGRDALARGDSDPCLRIMTALALELHPNNSKDETITRYARWTLRSLLEETGPALVIEAFCRGATVPEDDLVHLMLTAKEEMAEAVVRHLVIEQEVATRRRLEDLLMQMGDAALPGIKSALRAPTLESIKRLFPLLPRFAGPDAAEALKPLFRHYDPRIREESIRFLGKMHVEVTDDSLRKALADPEMSVRHAAMAVVGGLKMKAAVGPLLQIAQAPPGSRDVEEQKMAIATLGAIGDPKALPTLTALLRRRRWLQRRTTEKLRIAAAYALGKLEGSEAREALQAVGQSAGSAVRHACEAALRSPHASEDTERGQ